MKFAFTIEGKYPISPKELVIIKNGRKISYGFWHSDMTAQSFAKTEGMMLKL